MTCQRLKAGARARFPRPGGPEAELQAARCVLALLALKGAQDLVKRSLLPRKGVELEGTAQLGHGLSEVIPSIGRASHSLPTVGSSLPGGLESTPLVPLEKQTLKSLFPNPLSVPAPMGTAGSSAHCTHAKCSSQGEGCPSTTGTNLQGL